MHSAFDGRAFCLVSRWRLAIPPITPLLASWESCGTSERTRAMRNRCQTRSAGIFRHLPAVWLAVVQTLVFPANATAQQGMAQEGVIKAAFVYNFAKFTDWPEELWGKSPSLRLCTAGGKNAFSQAVAALHRQQSIRGKDIEVSTIIRPHESARCHLLVITGTESVGEWLRSTRYLPVLTVGDNKGFASTGGTIGLFVEGNKVKFAINPDAAHRAGIKISAKLLQLARLVKDEPGGLR